MSIETALAQSLKWADEEIPNRTKESTARKLMAELGELADSDFSDPMEFADVLICLYDLASKANVDLEIAVMTKVHINSKRIWKQLDNGTYQHSVGCDDAV